MLIAETLTPIEQAISQFAKEGTLILIDVGDTLIHHANPLAYKEHFPWILQWFKKNAPGRSQKEIHHLLLTIKNDNDSWVLTDPRWPSIIRQARKLGAKVIAFSKLVPESTIRMNRQQRLLSLGLDFNEDLDLPESPAYIYEKGICETTLKLKGACLIEILKSLKPSPSQILFVDNELYQVDSVSKACRQLNIPCLAFHFTETQYPPLLNPILADQELRELLRTP